MSGKTKIWLCAASFLIIIGFILFCIAMSLYDWDFKKLNTVKFETNTYEIAEQFDEILIDTTVSDIVIVPSEDYNCKVVCFEMENVKHSVLVVENKLSIIINDERNIFDYINIVNLSPKITIYLPIIEEMTFDINATTGDVTFENLAVKKLDINVRTGDINLKNIKCDSLFSIASTGDFELENVVVSGDIIIECSTGDINMKTVSCAKLDINISTGKTNLSNVLVSGDFNLNGTTGDVIFDTFDAKNIYVKVKTGDVCGTILTEKIFNVHSNTGKVKYPESYSGGICKINTSTGDVNIRYK